MSNKAIKIINIAAFGSVFIILISSRGTCSIRIRFFQRSISMQVRIKKQIMQIETPIPYPIRFERLFSHLNANAILRNVIFVSNVHVKSLSISNVSFVIRVWYHRGCLTATQRSMEEQNCAAVEKESRFILLQEMKTCPILASLPLHNVRGNKICRQFQSAP